MTKVEKMAERAFTIANTNNHEYVTLEHLLLSLLHEREITDLLVDTGAQPAKIKSDLMNFLSDPILRKPLSLMDIPAKRTQTFNRVFQRALTQVAFGPGAPISVESVLISMFSEEDSNAVYFLQKHGGDRSKLIDRITNRPDTPDAKPAPASPLDQFAQNLNRAASEGRIDPVVAREREIQDTVEILTRRKKSNVIYVGHPGVGKTSIAEGLALKIVNGDVPPSLANRVVYSLDLGAMVAGTKFRGEFEERMKNVLAQITKLGNVILFIDEIHMIMGAGASSSGQMDASNLLKPALARGQLQCIGATTYDEYHSHFEKDKALVRRFQKYDIDPPSASDTKTILRGVTRQYEEFHGVSFPVELVDLTVNLSDRYMKNRFFPDKAFDVMDQACVVARLAGDSTVTEKHVLGQVAKLAKISVDMIDLKENVSLKKLPTALKEAVYGQDSAIDTLVEAIYMSKSGLRATGKPVGSFLFTGSTGTGKTYLAKTLATTMGVPLKRFDMSEYMEKHTVSRLIGAPPGYVGHGEGKSGEGQLIQEIDNNPSCVLLLDEVEKAHPDVLTVLLQVMDEGRLTSSKGKTVDFSNVILIMSANIGAADAEKLRIGFGSQDNSGAVDRELKRFFSPEFRNRLDAVVKFNKLTPNEMGMIVDSEVTKTETGLSDRGITLNVTAEARQWLAQRGYDPLMGARPFSRLFEDRVKRPMSREILFGGLANGGTVTVQVLNDEIVVESVANLVVETTDAE